MASCRAGRRWSPGDGCGGTPIRFLAGSRGSQGRIGCGAGGGKPPEAANRIASPVSRGHDGHSRRIASSRRACPCVAASSALWQPPLSLRLFFIRLRPRPRRASRTPRQLPDGSRNSATTNSTSARRRQNGWKPPARRRCPRSTTPPSPAPTPKYGRAQKDRRRHREGHVARGAQLFRRQPELLV